MRQFPSIIALACVGLWSCSPASRAFRLNAPSPEIVRYKIICEKTMVACESRAAKVCSGPYTTLSSTASRTKPKRITSDPSPRSVGPRYQQERWYGTLLVDCHNSSSDNSSISAGGTDVTPKISASQPLPTPASVAATQRVCIPGATQACLGPGACRGAQACNPTGMGFLPCDCGPAKIGAPAPKVPHITAADSDSAAPEPDPSTP